MNMLTKAAVVAIVLAALLPLAMVSAESDADPEIGFEGPSTIEVGESADYEIIIPVEAGMPAISVQPVVDPDYIEVVGDYSYPAATAIHYIITLAGVAPVDLTIVSAEIAIGEDLYTVEMDVCVEGEFEFPLSFEAAMLTEDVIAGEYVTFEITKDPIDSEKVLEGVKVDFEMMTPVAPQYSYDGITWYGIESELPAIEDTIYIKFVYEEAGDAFVTIYLGTEDFYTGHGFMFTVMSADEPEEPMLYDLNGDGKVNYKDVALMTANMLFGKKVAPVNQSLDFNGDGKVNLKDLAILISNAF